MTLRMCNSMADRDTLSAFSPVTEVRTNSDARRHGKSCMSRRSPPVILCLKSSPAYMPQLAIQPHSHRRQRQVLKAVATFEFFKGIFVLVMGFCAIALVHKDVWLYAESLLALFHINTDRRSAQLFLDFADNVTAARLWAAARIAFAYTALRFAETYGLWNCRTWAEWVPLVSGALLLPLEVRELMRGVTLIRSALFLGNLAVVFFMLYVIRTNRRERQMAAASSTCD